MLKCKKSMCFENLKVLPIWNRRQSFYLIVFDDFVAIFGKKMTSKKFFSFKIFFSNFWKWLSLSIIWRDLKKKKFWKFQKKFFENFSFWKKCNFGHYFWFLTGFIHTNNLSQVLLSCLFKKFVCGMHTLCAPTHTKNTVCD